jgi:SAM-dependent methyltransferase
VTLSSPSNPLYDGLADHYDEHFAAPHRRAYDDLAWRACRPLWSGPPGSIVDVGCGVGRWAGRWLDAGHRVTGIEPAPRMAAAARARLAGRTGFTLLEATVDGADLPSGAYDGVVAMGSLQYAPDLPAALARVHGWLRPGGTVAVLVDSLAALVTELARAGRVEEAAERLRTRRGLWRTGGHEASLSLWDAAGLASAATAAGLTQVRVTGLLLGAAVEGVAGLNERLRADYDTALAQEWARAQAGPADLGKQLLLTARAGPSGPTG